MVTELARRSELPQPRDFMTIVKERWTKANTVLCVGLDSDFNQIPQWLKDSIGIDDIKQIIFEFNKDIIDAVAEYTAAFKPNIAFYEEQGAPGREALAQTVKYIHENHPKIPVLLDAKRNDIGNTAEKYARADYDVLGADGVTVNPYLGFDGVEPFLRKDKGPTLLCRTSNKSARDFQDRIDQETNKPMYQIVAMKAAEWNTDGNIGLVVGATYPQEMREVRSIFGNKGFLLIPGLGAQGGKPKDLVNGFNQDKTGILANSSRQIIFASKERDFAEAARIVAKNSRDEINRFR